VVTKIQKYFFSNTNVTMRPICIVKASIN